ncbi:MAG: endonuclease NucS domain-containing protein [Nitrosotalea sp.]
MIGSYYLQIDAASAFIVAIIAAIVICVIFYGIQRRAVSKLKENLNQMSSDLTNVKVSAPHFNEVASLNENVKKLCNDFTIFKTGMEEQMNKFSTTTTEDLNKTKELMVKNATEEIVQVANNHITENSVSKEEFEKLRQRIESMLGVDEIAERMEVLSSIFETSKINTLNWQCKLIKLLNGGLAPDAEEDQMVSHGIPMSSYSRFLEKLLENGLIEQKKIEGYYLLPEYEWIYSYVENADWLRNRLEGRTKKEREYHEFIMNSLNQIEEGLLLEQNEYELATGKIDFICRSSSGQAVGVELKYPAATTSAKRQLLGYKNDYMHKMGRTDARFILVAPKIPENLKLLLVQDGLEYKEISF